MCFVSFACLTLCFTASTSCSQAMAVVYFSGRNHEGAVIDFHHQSVPFIDCVCHQSTQAVLRRDTGQKQANNNVLLCLQ